MTGELPMTLAQITRRARTKIANAYEDILNTLLARSREKIIKCASEGYKKFEIAYQEDVVYWELYHAYNAVRCMMDIRNTDGVGLSHKELGELWITAKDKKVIVEWGDEDDSTTRTIPISYAGN